jgi:hypothetical protein
MVQKLPDGYRTVFNLHCVEAYSYPEIAAELGIAAHPQGEGTGALVGLDAGGTH